MFAPAVLNHPEADDRKVTSIMSTIIPHSIPPVKDEQGRFLTIRSDGSYYYRKPYAQPAQLPPGKRYCPACEKVEDEKLFLSKAGKLYVYCQLCRNEKARKRYASIGGLHQNLLRSYKITKEQYLHMLEAQGGVCACCKQPEYVINSKTKRVQRLSVDHDHKTGKVRALLCLACNSVIGYLENDPSRAMKALAYIEECKRVQETP